MNKQVIINNLNTSRKNTGTIIELNLREIACCHSVNAAGHVSGNDFM